jgi:membrane protein implicated in regulation of membrane protease activity
MTPPIHASMTDWFAGGALILGNAAAGVAGTVSGHGWEWVIQGGMAAIVVLLLLKFVPDLLKSASDKDKAFIDALERQNKAHAEAMKTLVDAFERHDCAWRELMKTRGFCPVRDNPEHK